MVHIIPPGRFEVSPHARLSTTTFADSSYFNTERINLHFSAPGRNYEVAGVRPAAVSCSSYGPENSPKAGHDAQSYFLLIPN